MYMGLLSARAGGQCHVFSSFFFSRLTAGNGYDYAGVRRWTKRVVCGLAPCARPFGGPPHTRLAALRRPKGAYQPSPDFRRPPAQEIFGFPLLLIPINHGNWHWSLAALWPAARTIWHLDSMPALARSAAVLKTARAPRTQSAAPGAGVGMSLRPPVAQLLAGRRKRDAAAGLGR